MRTADWLILKELEKLEAMVVAQQVQTNGKLDQILALLLQQEHRYVTPELEQVIRAVSVRVNHIDEKVPDQS